MIYFGLKNKPYFCMFFRFSYVFRFEICGAQNPEAQFRLRDTRYVDSLAFVKHIF